MNRNPQNTTLSSCDRKLSFSLTLIVLSTLLISCFDRASNTIQMEIASPGSKYKAVVFDRDGGATTDFSTQISVLSVSEYLPGGAGNAFICDSDHGKVIDSYDQGGPRVSVHWKSETLLVICLPKMARVFKKQDKIGEVDIEYFLDN